MDKIIKQHINPHRAAGTVVRIGTVGIVPVQVRLTVIAVPVGIGHIAGSSIIAMFDFSKRIAAAKRK